MSYEFSTIHWIYVSIMFLGAFYIGVLSFNPKGVPKVDYLINFFIPVWSGLAYMAMALGQGLADLGENITFYARYIDWVVTTPLLLLSLALTAMYHVKKNSTLILSLIGADIIMIVCGLVGDLSIGNIRYLWFSIGVVALLFVIYIIWGPLRSISREESEDLGKLYDFLAGYLTLFWIGYPISWIIGPAGLGIVSSKIDAYLFVILPIFSKVGFGILDILGLRRLNKE